MGDVAASGGYWISMSSDEVIADAGTVTGSIGVFALLPTGEKLMDKLSLHTAGYTTTWLGKGYDFRTGLDPRMASAVQSSIQHIYDEFTGKAAQARKKKIDEIDAVAQGRVWTGAQAKQNGLVDELGGIDRAVELVRQKAKISAGDKVTLVAYPPRRNLMQVLLNRDTDLTLLESRIFESHAQTRITQRIQEIFGELPLSAFGEGGILRRMPYSVIVR